jgi:hypothetical protein
VISTNDMILLSVSAGWSKTLSPSGDAMLHTLIKVELRSMTLGLQVVAAVSELWVGGRVALILVLEPKRLNLRKDIIDRQQMDGLG